MNLAFLALAAGLALMVGAALGLLGGGGSILTVPIFVYILDIEEQKAIAMSLAAVGLIAAFGVIGAAMRRLVMWKTGLVFSVTAMAGSVLGAWLAGLIDNGTVQMILFGVVMLLAAVLMLRHQTGNDAGGEFRWKDWRNLLLILAEGLAVGTLTGLVGVGGGFMIVPALVLLGRVPVALAAGTSLLVIALKSTTGFAEYLSIVTLTPQDWWVIGIFGVLGGAGTVFGQFVQSKLSSKGLQRGFAIFLLIMALAILTDKIVELSG